MAKNFMNKFSYIMSSKIKTSKAALISEQNKYLRDLYQQLTASIQGFYTI